MAKHIGKLVLGVAAVAGFFQLVGAGVSTARLNRELKPLAQEFERVATTTHTYPITVPGKYMNELKLKYDGKLTKITEKRDAYLATCGIGIESGRWVAHPVGYDEKTGKYTISPTTDDSRCLVPFKTLPSYAEFSIKYDGDHRAAASRALDKYQKTNSKQK